MDDIYVTILGMVAATCTTVAFVPQAWKTIRTKDTKSLSLVMYCILILGTLLWLTYGILIEDLPVIVANAVTSSFIAVILFMKIKHK